MDWTCHEAIAGDRHSPRQCCTEALGRAIRLSPDVLRDANEFRLTELAHAVERFDRDRNLGSAPGLIA